MSHKLAGGALNLGVTAAGRTAQQIELVADTGSTAGAVELTDQLERDLEAGRAALLAYQATYSTQLRFATTRAGYGCRHEDHHRARRRRSGSPSACSRPTSAATSATTGT